MSRSALLAPPAANFRHPEKESIIMKTNLHIFAIALALFIAPSSCFALWGIVSVTKEGAKEMGMEVRSTASGPKHLQVELEFKPEDKLKDFSHVDLRFDQGDNPTLNVALREDRSKPGFVVVSFTADRGQLEKMKLRVFVPESLGGTIYDLQIKDFVELKKDR
jgi:hypothetical protein